MLYEFIKSPNFWKGRRGFKPEAIVIHITEGTASSTIDWFTRIESQVSSHYLITRSGKVYQFVKEEDTAWHAGKVVQASWKLLKQGVNPNLYTIGIELEGFDDQKPTFIQALMTSAIISIICQKWKIPLDDQHIIPHRWIRRDKKCPGKGIDVKALVYLAKIIKN